MIKTLTLSLLLLFFGSNLLFAQNYESGKSYFDAEHWTEFIPGDMPLVISVPHGGAIVDKDIPVRSCPGAVTVMDNRTIELAREIQNAFLKRHGHRPYIIISNISRKNVDQNREIEIGTCGNAIAARPWNAFHDYIDTALAMAVKKYGSAIYIDLHGQGHPNQRLEVGYNLRPAELPAVSEGGDLSKLAEKSSLNNKLVMDPKANFKELMIGDNAFGTLMAAAGSPAIPSKQDPFISDGGAYFNGGYNTRRYTGANYLKVFGWQIESNFKGVRDAEHAPEFAARFADVMIKYIELNTKIKLK